MHLSIITINYNNLEGLRKTTESIICQINRDFEWIVIDGGSNDGSKQLIVDTAAQGYITYWCSEKDGGIYNAMNKGILKAKGDYCLFINSGDRLQDPFVTRDFNNLEWSEDLISGNIILDGNIDLLRTTARLEEIDYDYMCRMTILHPSTFIKKNLFDICGLYDESLKIVSDWKFFLICLIQYSCSYRKWERVITDFDSHGISESSDAKKILKKEREQVLRSFLPYVQKAIDKRDRSMIQLGILKKLFDYKSLFNAWIYWNGIRLISAPCSWFLKHKKSRMKDHCTKERIIVSMTSWKKRINNVRPVLDSILDNTIKPEIIVLNLAKEEFPLLEKSLPSDIIELVELGIVLLSWQNNNTKAFKKIIPTLKKYPHDAIISIDDDFIYPSYFIETFITKHRDKPNVPLSGNPLKTRGVQSHCGCASLVKLEYFGKYLDELLDDNIISMGKDDIFYTFCAKLNGVEYEQVGRLFFYNMIPNNPIDGLTEKTGSFSVNNEEYLISKIKKHYHLDFSSLKYPRFCL